MDDLIQKYHDSHNVVYELRALVDGEVKIKFTSSISFDDVSGFATLADERMEQDIVSDASDCAEGIAEANAEAQMEDERGN